MKDFVNRKFGLSTRRDFLKATGVGTLGLAVSGLTGPASGSPGKSDKKYPNILLVLTDDQGWTDTSVQMMKSRPDSKSDFYQTPALERMAKQGMTFSSAYSPSPVCGPTRESIQFGKTAARLKHRRNWKRCNERDKNRVSIPQMLKSINPDYRAAHFGKWGTICSPELKGYDASDGSTGNGEGDWNQDGSGLVGDNPKRIFGVTERANDFMEEQVKAGHPFYLQVSHYALHVQHDALKQTIEKYRKLPRGSKCIDADYQSPPPPLNQWIVEYAAMIENLDTGLGMLLDKLDELGIADNTYIIFFSDNGGDFRGNKPLKGEKATLWEGGIRVPMVVRGPGIKPGSYCDVPVAGWDFFPTFSDLAGNKNPLPEDIDGGSLCPLFENAGSANVHRINDYLIWHDPAWSIFGQRPAAAIRQGNYKLVKQLESGRIYLFNLETDIGEANNLADSMPQKAKHLHDKLIGYLEAVNAEDWRKLKEKNMISNKKLIDERKKEINAQLDKIKAENPEQIRREIRKLENHLEQINKTVRQSFNSHNPDAQDNYRKAKRQRLVIDRTIEALRQRLSQNEE